MMQDPGAEGRFNELYDRHVEAVRRYVWRRGPLLVDDVVAETFLAAWRRLDDVPVNALPWLIAVARNALLNERGRARQQTALTDRIAAEPAAAASESEAGISDPVMVALAALPQQDREILALSVWEDFDREAIALVLGCSKANVSLRLPRARRRLVKELERIGAEPRPRLRRATLTGDADA